MRPSQTTYHLQEANREAELTDFGAIAEQVRRH
jgi:hypothetical protein